MKEAGVLSAIGSNTTKQVGTSLAEKVTRIPGSGGLGKAVAAPRSLNKVRVGAALLGAAAAAGTGAALMTKKKDQEKQAAVGLLIEAGINFDTAVNLVEKKAAQLA